MNWKLRFKNKTTLTALIGAVFLFVKQISEIFGFDISGQLEQLSGSIGALLTILVSLGIVVDSTTKGVKDSGITQTYTKPRDENVDPVEYQKVVSDDAITPERKELTPTEFDTSEPFTDDTDEVEFDVADYDYDEELKRGASRYHDDEVLKESEKDGRKSNETTSD
ncbi:phage holin [Staphylococcus pettenkoferi]|uniref:phage holin n=1 Tax=Staphylococcus pettenkoferi TaxID=170573 RepID=UPI002275776A|nr:phage holin [Staphylococcus pettenkoferi]MCY1577175.1 phage holin [Staphylococcus pettenkoferi]